MTNLKHDYPFAAPALKTWRKAWGNQPTVEQFTTAVALCSNRPGKHALALAMYLRDEGATDLQVRAAAHTLSPDNALQGSLFNYLRANVAAGYIKRDMTVPKVDGPVGGKVYKGELTAKGQTAVKRSIDAAAAKLVANAPAKGKGAAKAKKAVKVPVAPVEQPVTVVEPSEGPRNVTQPADIQPAA